MSPETFTEVCYQLFRANIGFCAAQTGGAGGWCIEIKQSLNNAQLKVITDLGGIIDGNGIARIIGVDELTYIDGGDMGSE